MSFRKSIILIHPLEEVEYVVLCLGDEENNFPGSGNLTWSYGESEGNKAKMRLDILGTDLLKVVRKTLTLVRSFVSHLEVT